MKQAQIWSILGDETTDCSGRKQMVFVARYVDVVSDVCMIQEDPFSMAVFFRNRDHGQQ